MTHLHLAHSPTVSRKDKAIKRQEKVVDGLSTDLQRQLEKLVRMTEGMSATEAKAATDAVFFEGEEVMLKDAKFRVVRVSSGRVVLEGV